MSLNKWEHIFSKGEYPSREKILSGLNLEQVNTIPEGMPHSIYQEFWHLVEWQDVACSNDKEKDLKWQTDLTFPEHKAVALKQWEDLVKKFNYQIVKILDFAKTPSNLEAESEPGFTIAMGMDCIAVHNAFHFGKIVAIRQILGAWPPAENK